MKIPANFRKAVDEIKDEVVTNIFSDAKELEIRIKSFKEKSNASIQDYMSLLGNEYGVEYIGKGNISLINHSNTFKIIKAIHNFIMFDEKLQVAKALIDECITEWSNGADERIKILVLEAFKVDKSGNVSTDRVLSLRKLNIDDERWNRAMDAITDSLSVTHSREYIRLYKRVDEYSQWEQLSLNIATI